jgi:hypothetical protein
MLVRLPLLVFVALFSSALQATTIDFDSSPTGLLTTQTFDIGDYRFDFIGPFDPEYSPWAIGGVNNELSWAAGQGNIGLKHVADDTFSLFAIDLGGWGAGIQLTVTGSLAGGGTVQLDYVTLVDMETVMFGSEWLGLTNIEFSAYGCCALVDNIVVSNVPVPAAVWLFGSALGGLGWMRRRKTV